MSRETAPLSFFQGSHRGLKDSHCTQTVPSLSFLHDIRQKHVVAKLTSLLLASFNLRQTLLMKFATLKIPLTPKKEFMDYVYKLQEKENRVF